MMNLSKFATGYISSTGKPYLCVDTGKTIRGTTGPSNDPNADPLSTIEDISGNLLRDPTSDSLYLAGHFQRRYTGLYTGIIFKCQQSVNLYRYQQEPKDSFGRPAYPENNLVATDIPIHFHKNHSSINQQPDIPLAEGHIEALIQLSHEVNPADILATMFNKSYKIQAIELLPYGLSKLYLELLM